jgi:hypothetical protein
MAVEELLSEKNILQIAILSGFFFFGDWIYRLIIYNLKRRINSHVLGFIFSLGLILLVSSVPILLIDIILTKTSTSFGWLLSGIILIACLVKYYFT